MIVERNGRWTCDNCGYEWSALNGDSDIPDTCECENDPITITATWVKDVAGMKGAAKLYRLSSPVKYGTYWKDDGPDAANDRPSTEYVVVSAVYAFDHGGPETYIFPADETGKIIDFAEMNGSERGIFDHEAAIENAGWEIA